MILPSFTNKTGGITVKGLWVIVRQTKRAIGRDVGMETNNLNLVLIPEKERFMVLVAIIKLTWTSEFSVPGHFFIQDVFLHRFIIVFFLFVFLLLFYLKVGFKLIHCQRRMKAFVWGERAGQCLRPHLGNIVPRPKINLSWKNIDTFFNYVN